MRVHTLGRFLVEIDGQTLRFETKAKRKPLELLKVLIALGGVTVSVEQLIESLWPDSDGDRAYSSFATTLGRLRKLVGAGPLALQDGRLTLVDSLCWVDTQAFAALLSRSGKALEAGDTELAWQELHDALELYKGPFLDGEFEPPEILSAREKLHGLFLRHLEKLALVLAERGEYQRAAELCQRGLEGDDLAEELYQHLMRCYLAQGRLVEAAAVYQRCRQLFRASVGIDPSPATEEIHRAILAAQSQRAQSAEAPAAAPAAAPPAPTADGAAPEPAGQAAGTAPAARPAQAAPVAAEGIRRTATLALYKLSGFAAMNERLDPEEADAIVSRLGTQAETIVRRHGGQLNQFMLDELVVLFGIPVAHDDDPVRAVEASLALQQLAAELSPVVEQTIGQPLQLRAGIRTGLIVAQPNEHMPGHFSVSGEPVSVAARLLEAAGPGEIVVGTETWRQIEPYFLAEPLAPIALPGREQPVDCFRVGERTGVRTRIEAATRRGLTAFTGREQELGVLEACLAKSLAGEGQLVTVVGEAGLGKSRLLYEFRQHAEAAGAVVLECRAQATGGETPYLPYKDGLRRGFGIRDDASREENIETVRRNLLNVDPALEAYLPHYFHLLSIPSPAHPLPPELSGDALRQALSGALVALGIQRARQRPMVLLLEDWHWADAASTAAMRRCVAMMASHPLLLIVTHRPDLELNWGHLSFHTDLPLRPLGAEPTRAIVCSVLGVRSLPEGFAEHIHEGTGGNPFFVEEICTSLLEDGSVRVRKDAAELTAPLEELRMPDTVQAVIRMRVDRLGPEHQQVLRLASVIGREFDQRLLQQIAASRTPLPQLLEHLATQELIQPTRMLPEATYRFKHVLTQTVVYDTLLLQQRRKLHGAVAAALEAQHEGQLEEHYEVLAYHYQRSNDQEKAVRYLGLAGDKAATSYALGNARTQYWRALQLVAAQTPSPPVKLQHIDLTVKWAAASQYTPTAEHIESLATSEAYARELNDRRRLADVIYWHGRLLYVLGNMTLAREQFEEVRRLADELGDQELSARYLAFMGRFHWHAAEYDRSLEYLSRSIAEMERLGNRDDVIYLQSLLGIVLGWVGRFDEGVSLMESVIEQAREDQNPTRESATAVFLGMALAMRGDWARAEELGRTGGEHAERLANVMIASMGRWTRAYATYMLGDAKTAFSLMAHVPEWPIVHAPGAMLIFRAWLAEMHALEGDSKSAESVVARALAMSDETGQYTGMSTLHRASAMAAALAKRPSLKIVEGYMEKALEVAEACGARPEHAIGLFRQGERLLADHAKQAAALLDEAERRFKEMGMTWWLEQARTLRSG